MAAMDLEVEALESIALIKNDLSKIRQELDRTKKELEKTKQKLSLFEKENDEMDFMLDENEGALRGLSSISALMVTHVGKGTYEAHALDGLSLFADLALEKLVLKRKSLLTNKQIRS